MHTIQIRNLPTELFEGVKKAAKESRRSITQEVIHAIEAYLANKSNAAENLKRKEKALQNIRALQKKEPLTDLKQAMKWLKEDKK